MLTLAMAFVTTFAFSQLKVVAPNGDVAIGGITTPTMKVDIDGSLKVRGNLLRVGQDAGAGATRVQVGLGRSAIGASGFDFYTGTSTVLANFQTRLLATNDGFTRITHKGSNAITFQNADAAGSIEFFIGSSRKLTVNAGGFSLTNPISTTGYLIGSDDNLIVGQEDFKYGLESVMQINPVFYKMADGFKGNNELHVGIATSEMKKIAPEAVSTFTVVEEVNNRSTDKDNFERTKAVYENLDPTYIQYMLVNAVQEQQAMIESLTEKIAELETVIDNADISVQNVELNGATGALLQNVPNPFGDQTQISYVLPDNTQNAVMIFSDNNGRVMKNVTLSDLSSGIVTLKAGELNSGSYTYTLVADGQIVDTKKMVLTK